jgi:hypothetical protein
MKIIDQLARILVLIEILLLIRMIVLSRPDASLSMVRPWREVRDRLGRKMGICTQR